MNLLIYYNYNIVSYSNKSSHAEAIPVMFKSFLFILWIYSKFIESFREILEILGILWIQSNDQFWATVLSEASLRFSPDFLTSWAPVLIVIFHRYPGEGVNKVTELESSLSFLLIESLTNGIGVKYSLLWFLTFLFI